MANIKNNSEKNDNQLSEFATNQELKSNVYDAMEEQLVKSTETAFKSEGIKTREPKDAKGEQGWNRGVYGDGSTYGTGVKKGQGTVTVNRTKGSNSTNGFFEKNLSYGGKKMVVEIHVDIDCESETIDMTYQTTEQSAFRGHQDEKVGPYMINNKQTLEIDNISNFKKEIKKIFDKFAAKEVAYFINTKLGIEDRTEKSINSMVESNNKMKKLSLTDIINSNFDEAIDKIMESTKKSVDKHHPEIIDTNSPDNLLFDEDEIDEETVEEITASGGGAGAGAFLTPGAFKKGGDFDDEMDCKKGKIHEELQKKFDATPYSKRAQKRTLKRENKHGWTTVELDSDGYAPKGMDKNYAQGLHGVDVNSDEEDRLSKGSPKGAGAKKSMNEGLNLSKKKFVSLLENEQKGVNKRYIITHKKTKEEQSSRWASLSNFDRNSTIRLAESCGAPIEDGIHQEVSREEGEEMNFHEFMKKNNSIEHGDDVDGKTVVVIGKPGSLSGAEFTVFEDDYLNENKAFILDFNTGNLVNNPNYKINKQREELNAIREGFTPRAKVSLEKPEPLYENQAYVLNQDTGQLIRNKNYKKSL